MKWFIIENQNDNAIISKKKFYDIQLQMEITEREGNSSSSNINLFDVNKFIPFKIELMMII